MFSFVVFDPAGGPARNFTLRHAYLFGPDDLPLQGEITFDQGVVRCTKATPDAAGLALQFPVKPDGTPESVVILRTCLLPSRAEPYLLSLELARLRIMLFLNKLEEWGLFDLPGDHPIIRRFEEARQAFTRALVAQRSAAPADAVGGFSFAADREALSALALAYDAGEKLTILNGGRQALERTGGALFEQACKHFTTATSEKPPAGGVVVVPGAGHATLQGPPLVGCAINPGVFAEPLHQAAMATCDFVQMPMRWVDLEPVEGQYAFAPTDRWIEWAVRTAKLPVHAGPLIDFRPACTPEWAYIWENDYETLRELVVEHLQNVVTRYRRTVARWTVCAGLNVNQHFKLSFEQIMDLTKICTLVVRKLHPAGKIQIEIAQSFGEYHAQSRRTLPPLLYAEAINQAGIQFDALGLRLQFGQHEGGQACRDLMTISALLDRYAATEKPIAITGVGVPSAPLGPRPGRARAEVSLTDDDAAAPDATRLDPGCISGPWTDASQADWLARFFTLAAGKPYVHSVCWHDLLDYPPAAAPEMPAAGLVTAQGVLKPAGKRLAEFRAAIRERKDPAIHFAL